MGRWRSWLSHLFNMHVFHPTVDKTEGPQFESGSAPFFRFLTGVTSQRYAIDHDQRSYSILVLSPTA
jgi:hypothetical protein